MFSFRMLKSFHKNMKTITFSPLFLAGLILYISSFYFEVKAHQVKPRNPALVVEYLGDHFEYIPVTGNGLRTVYSGSGGDDLILKCQANFPIQWNISGLIAPAEIVKIRPPKRYLDSELFEISLAVFFLDASQYPGLAASAIIACESISNPISRDGISVFVRGRSTLVTPSVNSVVDSDLIPCPTTDPTTPTKLYLIDANNRETLVDDPLVSYHETEGFRTTGEVFKGRFACKAGSDRIDVFAERTFEKNAEFRYSPTSNIIKVFSDENIKLQCQSNGKAVTLKIDENTDIIVNRPPSNENEQIAELSVRGGGKGVNNNIQGRATCVTLTGTTIEKVVKEWRYEFIVAPELYLDNFEGEMDCLSSQTPKLVQTVRCVNHMHCNFMGNSCLQNETFCNFKKQKQFYANTDTRCWVESAGHGEPCASVPFSHLNGVAQCTVSGLTRRSEYFISLDYLRYSSWKDAPLHGLIKMDDIPSVLPIDKPVHFFCAASAFLFADSVTFDIEFTNGTRKLLKSNGITVNISNPYSENPRKIDEFNVLGALDIVLPADASAIHCLAPAWNSTDVLMISKRFHMKGYNLIALELSETRKVTFYSGERHRRLVCPWQGEPRPKYNWNFNGENVSEVFPDLKTSIGLNGEGYLEFPVIENKHSGEYSCVNLPLDQSAGIKYLLEVPDMCTYHDTCKQQGPTREPNSLD